jgi:hypothetical protein
MVFNGKGAARGQRRCTGWPVTVMVSESNNYSVKRVTVMALTTRTQNPKMLKIDSNIFKYVEHTGAIASFANCPVDTCLVRMQVPHAHIHARKHTQTHLPGAYAGTTLTFHVFPTFVTLGHCCHAVVALASCVCRSRRRNIRVLESVPVLSD